MTVRYHYFIFCIALLVLVYARLMNDYTYASDRVIFSKPMTNPLAILASAGPLPGLSADIKVLNVFSVYQAIVKSGEKKYAPLMAKNLSQASMLDPRFFDVYRLAGSLLVYDAGLPEAGVNLLDKGSLILQDSWELPFFAGFIAHDMLHDDEKAFELMNRVIGRPHTPPMAISLAAKFLKNIHSKEDALMFLQGLLTTMPKDYRQGIQRKIDKLQEAQE